MKKFTYPIVLLAFCVIGSGALLAQPPLQRMAVPLSSPGQPAVLEASLVYGTITVEAYDGNEVIVEVGELEDRKRKGCDDCEDDHDHDSDSEDGGRRRSAGMRRIPNRSVGLTIEERNNHVEVSSESWNRRSHLNIQVPRKTSLRLETVNGGDLVVMGAEGTHELQNTNGAITALDIRGSLVANTTNGDVEVRLLRIDSDKAMSFTTWNGDVDVAFPSNLSGVLMLNPGQGEIYTDFDLELQPVSPEVTTSPKRKGYRVEMKQEVKAVVGSGGPEMHFRTFNGSVYVRKIK